LRTGDLLLPRAREGGFGGGFFACWTPPHPESGWTEKSTLTLTEDGYEVADAPLLDPSYARETADEPAKILFKVEAGSGGRVKVVRTARELESCLRNGVLAAVLHFDGAKIAREIGDASGLPKLLAALRERGYDEAALKKLAHENWVRVLRATWGG
jgi:membrane dipeptidase